METIYLTDNQKLLSKYFRENYPAGFVFFCAGNLLLTFSQNFTIEYMFIKLGFFPILAYYIILFYYISQRIFSDKYFLKYACILTIPIYDYLIQRTILFLPSSIVNLLILICIIIVITDVPDYLIGFIIPSMYLIHNLSAFYFLMSFIIFYLIKIIKNLKRKEIFKEKILEALKIIVISISLLIPYIIHANIEYDVNILDIILNYFKQFKLDNSIFVLFIISEKLSLLLNIKIYLDITNFYLISEWILTKTSNIFFFAIFGLFIVNKIDRNIKLIEFRIYIKICFIISFFVLYIGIFIPNLSENPFYDFAKKRSLESFSFQIILLSFIFLEWILTKLNILSNFLYNKYKSIKKFLEIRQLKRLFPFFKLITLVFLIFSWLYIIENNKYYYHYYNYNYFNENIIFINENIPHNSNIAVRNLTESENGINSPYLLLIYYNIFYYSKSMNHSNYYNFLKFCENNSIDYIIFKLNFFNKTDQNLFLNSSYFKRIYIPLERDWIYGVYQFIKN
ncbi:MAG: hypothetical protein ACTSQP_24655 [Promethearchaeota archaeon]